MKKTGRITLTVVAAVAMAACARRPDPCDAANFNDQWCQDAIRNGGYYYNGSWTHMGYSHPYTWYYDSYRSYVSRGGTVTPAAGSYSHPSGSSVVRGGFGSTGSGHSSGSGE